MEGTRFQPSPLWKRRYSRPWYVGVSLVFALFMVVDTLIAPAIAPLDWAQTFAENVSHIIGGLEAAASVVAFESEARVILAMDRLMVPVGVILLLLGNVRVISYKPSVHPGWLLIFVVLGVVLLTYIYFVPLVPDPESTTRSKRAISMLLIGGPNGFAFVHAMFSMGLVLGVTLAVNAAIRYGELLSAYAERQGNGMGK